MLYALCSMPYALRRVPYALRHVASGRLIMVALAVLTLLALTTTNSLAVEKKFQWSTRITVSEQYDDNINLTADEGEEEDDWITTVGPGLTLGVLFEEFDVKLNYDLGYSYYAKDQDNNTLRHTLSLTGMEGIPIAERWTFGLTESLYISEDPIEEDEGVTTRRGRNRYYRNTAGARLNYLYGTRGSLYLGFTHRLLENKDPDIEDSQEFRPATGLNHWFNIRHGISFGYEYARIKLEDSDDLDKHVGRTTYNYRFSLKTQANISYNIDSTDFDGDEEDYIVHSGRLGISQQITEHDSWSISGGFFYRDREERDDTDGFDGAASINHRLEKGSISLNAAGGYREQYIEAENLGFSRFYRASLGFNYELLERLSTNISGFYQRDEFRDRTPKRDDDTLQGRVGLSYLLLPWLSGSFSYQYRERKSTEDAEEYQDNRVTISLVAFYVSEAHPF